MPPTTSQFAPRTAWYNVNDSDIQNFCYMISDSLPTLPSDLVLCSDPSCLKHRSSLDFYCSTLLCCISDAARLTLPVTSSSSPRIAGWNDAARPIFGTKSGVMPALPPLVCCYKSRKPQRGGINMKLGVSSDNKRISGEGEWLMPLLTPTLVTSGKK